MAVLWESADVIMHVLHAMHKALLLNSSNIPLSRVTMIPQVRMATVLNPEPGQMKHYGYSCLSFL